MKEKESMQEMFKQMIFLYNIFSAFCLGYKMLVIVALYSAWC